MTEEERTIIIKNFSWFVGRTLSYLDITIADVADSKDKHPKKVVLKKLFEKDIYALREKLLQLNAAEIRKQIHPMIAKMLETLSNYTMASITDKLQKYTFNQLLSEAAQELENNLKEEMK